jgi:hypothetical protein
MRAIVGIAVVLCMALSPAISSAQTIPYRLLPGKCGIATELGFQEDMTSLLSTFRYGISQNINGSLTLGLSFVAEELILGGMILPGFSVPPVPVFAVGFGAVGGLGKTGLDYWLTVDSGVAFGELVYDPTGETVIDLRTLAVVTRAGLMKKIKLGTGLVFAPLIGVSNRQTWADIESELIMNIARRSDNIWSGLAGLAVEISSKLSVAGTVEFSFGEESQIFCITNVDRSHIVLYSIALSFRP